MIHHDHSANPGRQSTVARIEQLHGKEALLATWEQMPEELRMQEHDYLLELRKNIRQVRNYIVHRRDPGADLVRKHKSDA